MEYKALLTRMYSMADESLQIIIPNTDDIEVFKQRIYNALKICDYRANEQMMRLFEDTELTTELSYDELKAARTAATIMYPKEHIPAKLDLGQGTTDYDTAFGPAFEFAKNLASGEVIKIFLHRVDAYEDIGIAVKAIWDIQDTRLYKTNKRELDFIEYIKRQAPSVKLKITKIMEILYGRHFKEDVIKELQGARLEETVEVIRKENEARNVT